MIYVICGALLLIGLAIFALGFAKVTADLLWYYITAVYYYFTSTEKEDKK